MPMSARFQRGGDLSKAAMNLPGFSPMAWAKSKNSTTSIRRSPRSMREM